MRRAFCWSPSRGKGRFDQAARTLSRKPSTSAFNRSDCFDSSLAELSTCVDAAPTSPDACVTPAIFEETSLVPAAAALTLFAISRVAAPC